MNITERQTVRALSGLTLTQSPNPEMQRIVDSVSEVLARLKRDIGLLNEDRTLSVEGRAQRIPDLVDRTKRSLREVRRLALDPATADYNQRRNAMQLALQDRQAKLTQGNWHQDWPFLRSKRGDEALRLAEQAATRPDYPDTAMLAMLAGSNEHGHATPDQARLAFFRTMNPEADQVVQTQKWLVQMDEAVGQVEKALDQVDPERALEAEFWTLNASDYWSAAAKAAGDRPPQAPENTPERPTSTIESRQASA